ncbi:hypothetical protein AAKU52_002398 [Pedobacter sp. CG_S7]|uniref:DUF4397 domain-containing protein n=1 Tax=Pedobacter sp. CG_S7 TaxID=3143930 RepID=UPI0033920EB2
MKKLIYIFSLVAITFSGCTKGDLVESTEYTKISAGDPAYSYIRFINLTPASPVINFNLNDVRVSGNASTNGKEAGYTYLGVFPGLGGTFIPAKVGVNAITAKIVSSAIADANLEVFNTSINTAAGKYYTLYTTGTYNITNKKVESSLLMEEVKPALDTSKVFIRVVNLYNGGPNIDFVQKTTSQKIVSNLAYGTASAFVEIPMPGQSNLYNINQNTTGATLIATTAITLIKGQAYTFIIRGVNGSIATPIGVNYYATFY